TLLSKEAVDELAKQAPPDDPAAVLARATRRILALLGATRDAPDRREQLARADADLRLVRRLAPGSAVVLPWRAALAAVAGRTGEAHAFFGATSELCAWSSRTVEHGAFEALVWTHVKKLELARS